MKRKIEHEPCSQSLEKNSELNGHEKGNDKSIFDLISQQVFVVFGIAIVDFFSWFYPKEVELFPCERG